jgi:hypothetical protein
MNVQGNVNPGYKQDYEDGGMDASGSIKRQYFFG